MNIYIDLGAYKGHILKRMVDIFIDTDLFVAFEPVPHFYHKIVKKFKNNSKVKVLNCAAACSDDPIAGLRSRPERSCHDWRAQSSLGGRPSLR